MQDEEGKQPTEALCARHSRRGGRCMVVLPICNATNWSYSQHGQLGNSAVCHGCSMSAGACAAGRNVCRITATAGWRGRWGLARGGKLDVCQSAERDKPQVRRQPEVGLSRMNLQRAAHRFLKGVTAQHAVCRRAQTSDARLVAVASTLAAACCTCLLAWRARSPSTRFCLGSTSRVL